MSSPRVGDKKRKREGGDKPINVEKLKDFIGREEEGLRAAAKEILDKTLIAQSEVATKLTQRLETLTDYQEALDSGFVLELRKELMKTYRMGVKLEAWCNSYTPPLASGGNAGVSGEVQDGIYANIHALTAGCSSALHAMLAFEKEFCVQQVGAGLIFFRACRAEVAGSLRRSTTLSR